MFCDQAHTCLCRRRQCSFAARLLLQGQGQSRGGEGTPAARAGGPPATPPSVTSGPSAAPSGSGELPPIRTDSSQGLDPDSFAKGALSDLWLRWHGRAAVMHNAAVPICHGCNLPQLVLAVLCTELGF